MELRTFIKTAILDILNGVTDAQAEAKSGKVVPNIPTSTKSKELGRTKFQVIDFDILVKVDESKGTEGKLGVVNAFVGAGISGKSSNANTSSTSLKFKIPVELPTDAG